MQYTSHLRLSTSEKAACHRLVELCHQNDSTFHQPYLDNLYNFDRHMPAFVLAWDEEILGFLSIYADAPKEAQLEIFVHPKHRKKGIATRLLQEFQKIADQYQLLNRSFVIEKAFLDQHPTILSHFQLKETDECELWLTLPHQCLPLKKRADLMVDLASMEDVKNIASISAKAFGYDLDYSYHYACESLKNKEVQLYILKKDDQIVASVSLDSGQKSNHFYGLAVDREFKRQGLATYLLKSVINLIAEKNQDRFQIVVEKENYPALFLYQKLGFKIKAEVLYAVAIS